MSLNNLPSTLKILVCAYNHISSLDNLPQSLEQLSCGGNQLTSLDRLPENLKILRCYDNNITQLNNLPDSLEKLSCRGNQLPSNKLSFWKGVKRFRKFYFTAKYFSRLERKFIERRNKVRNEEIITTVYSPDYGFYKLLADKDTMLFFSE